MTGPSRPAAGPRPAVRPQRPPLYQRWPLIAGLLRQWPLLLVIVVVGIGLLLVAVDRWRTGVFLMGLGLVLAGVLRMSLPVRRVGFLAVRSRPIDVTLTIGAGLAVDLLVLVIPSG